jgi:hypothetical protein
MVRQWQGRGGNLPGLSLTAEQCRALQMLAAAAADAP